MTSRVPLSDASHGLPIVHFAPPAAANEFLKQVVKAIHFPQDFRERHVNALHLKTATGFEQPHDQSALIDEVNQHGDRQRREGIL